MRAKVLFVGLLLIAMGGLVGCKNVCQKAAAHYTECWEAHCADNADDERCERALNNPVAEAMSGASSCPNEERRQRLLDASCEAITSGEEGL